MILQSLRNHLVAACLAVLAVLAGFFTPYFWTDATLLNILSESAMPALLAIGACFVIGTGQIDLSVGSLSALGGLVAVSVANHTGSFEIGLLAAATSGLLAGILNGVLAKWIPSFIVTLGTLGVFRGFALLASGYPVHLEGLSAFWVGSTFVIPPVLASAAALFVFRRTQFGLKLLGVGSNLIGARNAGLFVDLYRIAAFAINDTIAALAGALIAIRLGSAGPTAGAGYELDAIAAAILGGSSLTGGRVSISGTVAAVILFATIRNTFTLLNYPPALQEVLTGVVLIMVVVIQFTGTRKRI